MKKNPDSLMDLASSVPSVKPAPAASSRIFEELRHVEKKAKRVKGVIEI